MTIIKSICTTALLTLIVTAGTAQAAGKMGSGRGPMSFSDFDKNGDGMISREEFAATQQNRIETQTQTREMSGAPGTPPMATPGAGMGMQQQNRQQMQQQMQQQTQQRMRAANMPTFSDFDLDGDGNVTEKEFYTSRNNRIRQRVLEGKPMRNMSNAPPFSSIDTNGDKQLTEEEFNMHQDQHMKMWEE
jgi:Ca2+-binding EF-hand superfamily protein